ncbi:P2X purinoceptor 7-like isoform X2 [Mizuhopecten yessoensis]|uniref:P2X purinoceptor 7-like isoform X2 n=1 Tax=Mizuhopecten yessoensis TaxID=6573 RepID=UPI000B45B20A|nr:P2X purinoceptor 7-like isoform X2 [Mizuhopecten yessoensis]
MEKTELWTQQKHRHKMSLEAFRHLVDNLVEMDLSPFSYLCLQSGKRDDRESSPPRNTPTWCICHHCDEMPKVVERKCCGKTPELCVSKRSMDKLVLDPEVLYIGDVCQANLLEMISDKADVRHRYMRQAAYRNFTLWQEGRLGKSNRKPVPSCCVWRIRDKFPDSNKRYTGFFRKRFASNTLS